MHQAGFPALLEDDIYCYKASAADVIYLLMPFGTTQSNLDALLTHCNRGGYCIHCVGQYAYLKIRGQWSRCAWRYPANDVFILWHHVRSSLNLIVTSGTRTLRRDVMVVWHGLRPSESVADSAIARASSLSSERA